MSNFRLNKTSGSRNTTVTVSTIQQNDTGAYLESKMRVAKGAIAKDVTLRQMYRPIVSWYGTDDPVFSPLGGRATFKVDSPYDFYIWQVPDIVGNLYQGKRFAAGEQYIEVQVNTAESSDYEDYFIQIAFDRFDGRKSYQTSDGANNFKLNFSQEGYVERSITISPEDIISNWQENTFRINVTFIGRMENETLAFDYNESYPFFTWTAPVWESPTSPNGYVDVTIEENDGQARSNYLAFMSPSQDVRMDLGINQNAYQPVVPKVSIEYHTTNCLVRPMSLMVDQYSRYETTITPKAGYKLDFNNFTINVDGDDITGDSGVLTKQSNGSWKVVIESVYGASLIAAYPQPIVTQYFSVDYWGDGVTFSNNPINIEEGETLTATLTVDDDYDVDGLSVEVFMDADIADYTLVYSGGRSYTLTVPNVTGDLEINAFAAAFAIMPLGIRFDSDGRIGFYCEDPVDREVSISLEVDGCLYAYVIPAGSRDVSINDNGEFLTIQDFDKNWRNLQIEGCYVNYPTDGTTLETSLSSEFISAMTAVGNNSYWNVEWAA